jgi:hypothetical protein
MHEGVRIFLVAHKPMQIIKQDYQIIMPNSKWNSSANWQLTYFIQSGDELPRSARDTPYTRIPL